MTDEELGKALYEEQARHWPKPVGWANLPCKQLWIERAKKRKPQSL